MDDRKASDQLITVSPSDRDAVRLLCLLPYVLTVARGGGCVDLVDQEKPRRRQVTRIHSPWGRM